MNAPPLVPTAADDDLFVAFRLQDLDFVLPITRVREVLKVQEVTRVPLASSLIAGLINLRGEIVPAVDLRPLLGAAPGLRSADMLVVVRADEGAFSLVVDEVHDIVELQAESLREAPANLPTDLGPLTDGVCTLPDRLLLSLDVQGVARLVESHRHPLSA